MKNSKILKIIILIIAIIAIIGSITLILNKSSKKELKPVEQIKTEEKSKNELKQENNEKENKTEDKKDSEETKKEESNDNNDESTQENTNKNTASNNNTNQSNQQTQPVVEQPKSQEWTCQILDDGVYEYIMESKEECEELTNSMDLYFAKFDINVDQANASIPAKFKKYYSFTSRDVYTYYTYTVTETDDEKSVAYTPHIDYMKKYDATIMNIIGSFESYNPDWENKPAGTYETIKIKHIQILTDYK